MPPLPRKEGIGSIEGCSIGNGDGSNLPTPNGGRVAMSAVQPPWRPEAALGTGPPARLTLPLREPGGRPDEEPGKCGKSSRLPLNGLLPPPLPVGSAAPGGGAGADEEPEARWWTCCGGQSANSGSGGSNIVNEGVLEAEPHEPLPVAPGCPPLWTGAGGAAAAALRWPPLAGTRYEADLASGAGAAAKLSEPAGPGATEADTPGVAVPEKLALAGATEAEEPDAWQHLGSITGVTGPAGCGAVITTILGSMNATDGGTYEGCLVSRSTLGGGT